MRELTRSTSRRAWHKLKKERRQRVLVPLLGAAVCLAHTGQGSDYSIRRTKQKVQIGVRTYSSKLREDDAAVYTSRASWFRIRCSNVPHYVAAHEDDVDAAGESTFDPNEMLFGRFIQFLEVVLPA